ncbi:MAG: Bug family tripartite tricarboxylate transporter substrate binding protein, partial [Acetobacteraceae bacterium]
MLRFLILFILLASSAQAQHFPDRAMRMVVGFAPGGTTDIVARIVAESMSKHFNQQIVVENRGGAGGVPAALVVLQVPANGYTLMLQSGGLNQAEALGTPLPFDAVDAWSPIGLVATSAISLVVTNSLPVINLRELQAYAKSTDTALRFGSPGVSLGACLIMAVGFFFTLTSARFLVRVPLCLSCCLVELEDVVGGADHGP